jgi:hypothetical protein
MRLGFIVPEPNWDITFPNVDPSEWEDDEDDE